MDWHQAQDASAHQQQPLTGLEGHVRNLILSNGDQGAVAQGPHSHQPSLPSNGTSQNSAGTDGIPPERGPSQNARGGRKRPNQAQRRQMSSQMSVDIDPRAQGWDAQAHRGSFDHPHQEGRFSGSSPRHYHTNSQPHVQGMHSHGPGSFSRGQSGGWRGRQSDAFNRHPGGRHQYDAPTHQADSPGRFFNPHHGRTLFEPQRQQFSPEEVDAQAQLLEELSHQVMRNSEIDLEEISQKEAFRQAIELLCRDTIDRFEQQHGAAGSFPASSVELKCFGSLSSGFATKASDMDLGLLSPLSMVQPDAPGSPIPRLIEKAFLDAGLGARLLSRTRVPIIKLCEKPSEKLRRGLLAEREKWERGLDEENEKVKVAQEHDDNEPADETRPLQDPEEPHKGHSGIPSNFYFEIPPKREGQEPQTFFLRQGAGSDLSAYYTSAKAVLRKSGLRDVNAANHRELSPRDTAALNRICEAFIDGLFDEKLRDRLREYPSLAFHSHIPTPCDRSLFGVSLQIEGEQIAMACESWLANDTFHPQMVQLQGDLNAWRQLQLSTTFGHEPFIYNRNLTYALDKLRKSPLVRFLQLEQVRFESASQYQTRATEIINNLGPPNDSAMASTQPFAQSFVKQYIAGAYDAEIRDALTAATSEPPGPNELGKILVVHKGLQLARELERAAEKGLYEDNEADDVRAYANFLRSSSHLAQEVNGSEAFVIPVPHDLLATIAHVRGLPDPQRKNPNQPRDRYFDRLEFPKTGAGVQCDINFSAHLGLQNSLLLRCYSHTDPRVRPMVLFIKHWAKVRGINSGYHGTLSSYGYVLMVLHYLVNVAQPFVCPNLQHLAPPAPPNPSPMEVESTLMCKGADIRFWRNEQEIIHFAQTNQLNQNADTVGHLLRGFFEYYAQNGAMSNGSGKQGFDWGRNVLSIRSNGGLLTKNKKGWTGAKTVLQVKGAAPDSQNVAAEGKGGQTPSQGSTKALAKGPEVTEVRNRYLFAIEDPFEINHNVARTVTHHGIVSIRDEFRRAWGIIRAAGKGTWQESLLEESKPDKVDDKSFSDLVGEIHGLK